MTNTRTVIDIGGVVLCDSCNADYTASDMSGGFIFSSNAYCPVCAPRMYDNAKKYGELSHIRAHCPTGMSFGDFIRRYRGGNNTVVIETFDNHADAIAAMSGKRERDNK